jgi:hypothetical protein
MARRGRNPADPRGRHGPHPSGRNRKTAQPRSAARRSDRRGQVEVSDREVAAECPRTAGAISSCGGVAWFAMSPARCAHHTAAKTRTRTKDDRQGIRRRRGRRAMVVAVRSCPSLCPSNGMARRVRDGRRGRGGRRDLARCHRVDGVDGCGRTTIPRSSVRSQPGPRINHLAVVLDQLDSGFALLLGTYEGSVVAPNEELES